MPFWYPLECVLSIRSITENNANEPESKEHQFKNYWEHVLQSTQTTYLAVLARSARFIL